MMSVLESIRSAVRTQNYRVSAHANKEMSEDDLDIQDVELIILPADGFHGSSRKIRVARDTRFGGEALTGGMRA